MAPEDGRPCEGWPLNAIWGGWEEGSSNWCIDAHMLFSVGSILVQFGSIWVQLVQFWFSFELNQN